MMRDYLNGSLCKEAFHAFGYICCFNDVLRFHDLTRFKSVEFSNGEEGKRFDFTINREFLDQHCERVSELMIQTGDYKGSEDNYYSDFLVRGKDISLHVCTSSLQLVVDVYTVTEADIEAVLRHFYPPMDAEKAQISLLLKNKDRGYYFQKRQLENVSVNLEDSYNEGFISFHQHVVQELNKRNGLVLLHGLPGTGKTTYIKYLSSIVNRDFIFIPEILSDAINSPELVPILMRMERPIIILEDAEKMLVSRDKNVDNKVSSVLNLSNGILGDYIDASVICTFNTDLQNIDRALLREGRLIGNWEFGKLDVERCRKVAASQDIQLDIIKPMTVSEILHHKNILSNTPTKKPYKFNGFAAAAE